MNPPAKHGEWGYRPADESTSRVNPPGFCWRPQSKVESWELQCATGADFAELVYSKSGIEFNVHCPPKSFEPGEYFWRYRGKTAKGGYTNWSKTRRFTIPKSAVVMPNAAAGGTPLAYSEGTPLGFSSAPTTATGFAN